MDPVKCRALVDEFYKITGNDQFPSIGKFMAWVKENKTPEDEANCKLLLEAFDKSEGSGAITLDHKTVVHHHGLKTEDVSLGSFTPWLRKMVTTFKKSPKDDWVGDFLNS